MPLKKCAIALAAGALLTCASMGVLAQVPKVPGAGAATKARAVLQPQPAPPPAATAPAPAAAPAHAPAPGGVTKAIAVIHATKSGGDVQGEVTFTQGADGRIRVQVDIKGLKPGKHGFHIHEFGDVSSPDAMSAGGHFNPEMMKHASPESPMRHEGDLGNITADEKGHAKLDVIDPALHFSGPMSILGRSVIVHEKEDDLKTQPTGAAGGRIGAGVIGVAKPG